MNTVADIIARLATATRDQLLAIYTTMVVPLPPAGPGNRTQTNLRLVLEPALTAMGPGTALTPAQRTQLAALFGIPIIPPAPVAPTLTVPDPLPHAVVGLPFGFTIDVVPAGTLVTVNNLPGYAAFDAATRRVTGTAGPGDVGMTMIEIVANNGGLIDTAWRDLYADGALEIIEPAGPLPVAVANAPYHAHVQANLPGAALDIPGLGAWATFTAATGDIDGTPGPGDVGTRNLMVRATLPGRPPVTRAASLTVNPELQVATTTPINGRQNTVYRGFTPRANGGVAPYASWRVSRGHLPHGMTLNATTGQPTGTPDRAEASTFTLEVTDAGGNTAEGDFTITVDRAAAPAPGPSRWGNIPWGRLALATLALGALALVVLVGIPTLAPKGVQADFDKCTNLNGIQAFVPSGYMQNADGTCTQDGTGTTSTGTNTGTTNTGQGNNGQPTGTPGAQTGGPAPTLGNIVVVEPDGRIWMPNGNPPNGYVTTFKAPTTGNMTRRWMGVNAVLIDSTGNQVAGMANNFVVTLRPGETYTVKGGSTNGGFALEVVR